MALIRWEPFREMDILRRQIDYLFDDLSTANRGLNNFPKETQTTWAPAIEIKESDADVVLRAEIPGVTAKDLDVQVTKDAVLISGEHRHEKQTEDKSHFRSEFRYGKFQRVVPLPAHIQNDQVGAEFKDGVLTLTLPKVEAHQKVVKINLGEAQPAAALDVGNDHAAPEAQAAAVKPTGESD